jgi:hypothetical protein
MGPRAGLDNPERRASIVTAYGLDGPGFSFHGGK